MTEELWERFERLRKRMEEMHGELTEIEAAPLGIGSARRAAIELEDTLARLRNLSDPNITTDELRHS